MDISSFAPNQDSGVNFSINVICSCQWQQWRLVRLIGKAVTFRAAGSVASAYNVSLALISGDLVAIYCLGTSLPVCLFPSVWMFIYRKPFIDFEV